MATVNHAGYSGSITVSGGSGTYKDLQVAGLPPGLTAALSGHSILVRGTPTQQGLFNNITVTLQDSRGESGSGTYNMTINPPIVLGDLDPTVWDVNQPNYDGDIPISGGTGGYTNLKVTGLPTGLVPSLLTGTANVNGKPVESGTLSFPGTPTQSGKFTVSVSLTDATGATDPDLYSLTINPANVDLKVSVNAAAIVPVLATDLNMSFFFGTEQVRIPVTFGNGGPDTAKGNVTLKLVLSENANGSGTQIPRQLSPWL